MKTYPIEQALRAQKALREAAGLGPEMFPLEAFVGMISDEIEQLRSQGKTDADIAALIAKNSNNYLQKYHPRYCDSTVRKLYGTIRELKQWPERGRQGRGESRRIAGDPLHALQFRQNSSVSPGYSGNGCGCNGTVVVD